MKQHGTLIKVSIFTVAMLLVAAVSGGRVR